MSKVKIMDGGLGQELIRRAGKATPLWSLQALLDDPDMVRDVHAQYFDCGAEIATANTYSIRPDRVAKWDLVDRMPELMETACRLATEARDAHGSGQVLGSLSPLGYSYQPHLAPPSERAAPVYADLAAMQAPFVDAILLETMGSVDEARGALMGTANAGVPIWLSVSLDDSDGTKLRSGEPVSDVVALVEEFGAAQLFLNCSLPEVMSDGLRNLSAAKVPLGVYANGFTGIAAGFDNNDATVDLLAARTDLGPEAYLAFAEDWVKHGASWIGGCCEVGPDHIRALAAHFSG